MFKWFLGLFSKKNARAKVLVLCRIWMEDGVWNASAHDLPVAVYGETLEQAKDNLLDGICSHLNALETLGRIDPVILELQRLAAERRLSADEMAGAGLFWVAKTGVTGNQYEAHA